MKTSTEIWSTSKIVGEEKAVELVAKAGFDAWDFSMFEMARYDWKEGKLTDTPHPLKGAHYLEFARRLRRIGEDNGIVCNQSHAPFPSYAENMMPYLMRAIECTAEAGGEICIIHPCNSKGPEENAEMYNELLPFAKQCGIKIATENMFNWNTEKDEAAFAACMTPESFNAHLDAVNDDALCACLDIGHAEMRGTGTSATELIRALGKRLKALHVHDNDKHRDRHQIPFSLDIGFEDIARELKSIGYDGYITLEADQYLGSKGYTPENVFEGVKELSKAARRFADMVE